MTYITDEGKEAIQCNQINASNGYKDSCINHWKPIKAHIINHEALPKEALKPPQQSQRLGTMGMYIYNPPNTKVHRHSQKYSLLYY